MVSLSPASRPVPSLPIWLAYVLFVVYGSLVPLDFVPRDIDRAWAAFQAMPMYRLGVESRADWIANGVLYVPLAFLSAQLLTRNARGAQRVRVVLYGVAGVFCVALAIAVEFAQVFFPPRTVSRNDLVAECIGSVVGLLLATRYSAWFERLLHAVAHPSQRLLRRLLEAYLVGYLAFSLFPYDLLLDRAEIAQKFNGDNWGWLLAGDSGKPFLIAIKLVAEVVLTVPFGLYLGARRAPAHASCRQALLAGLVLGGCIELAQFFIASGVSQGLSLLTRAAGVCAGLALWNRRAALSPEALADVVRRHALALAVAYLPLLLGVNGWFSHRWGDAGFAVSRLDTLHFLPFYYHYFTTEAKALVSLGAVCLSYAPIGVLTWARNRQAWQALGTAAALAALVETGKLFMPATHPDPTNVILAALAAWSTFHLVRVLSRAALVATEPAGESADGHAPSPAPRRRTHADPGHYASAAAPSAQWTSALLAAPALALAAYGAMTFPTQAVALAGALVVYAVVLWQQPLLLFLVVPAALPVLDLAPWSGRFFFDEFDLLLLVSVSVGVLRLPRSHAAAAREQRHFAWASSLLAISLAVAALRGLTPWQALDGNAFSSYFSHYNALRIGKGALWAWLVCTLLRRACDAQLDAQKYWSGGMILGVTLTLAFIFWERIAFSGLFDFAHDYRVTGPFSATHVGGAYVECFLTISAPYVLIALFQARSWAGRTAMILLLLILTYALMVTFSRNGYLALTAALFVVLLFANSRSRLWRQHALTALALTVAVVAVALPILRGPFAQNRLATVDADYLVRQTHWQKALETRPADLLTGLFGMGLGRFPEHFSLLSQERDQAGTYRLLSENGNTFLRLGAGVPIYVEQLIAVRPQQKYVLKFDARSDRRDATLSVPICEKWMLTSLNCAWSTQTIGEAGSWRHFALPISTDALTAPAWYAHRPTKLALYNGSQTAIVEVDNVRLETLAGENLLRNGDFSAGLDHWFFSADRHLQWHIHSLPIAVLFDQGWLGVVALGVFSALAIGRAGARAWRGDLYASAVLASFCGFLVVGLFDTLIDAPRFLFLFLVLGWFAGSDTLRAASRKRGD
jgi:VanZ family protein